MGHAGSALALFARHDALVTSTFRTATASTFYPAEMGTYGLALQARAQSSWSGNVHFQPDVANDFSATFLSGVATYDQYDTPYAGERWATFNSSSTSFPGEPPIRTHR